MLISTVGIWYYWQHYQPEFETEATVEISNELTREQLDLRDGTLFIKDSDEVFSGNLVENYPGGEQKVLIAIKEGRAHGLSLGWYEDGQKEVEEHFVKGISHGGRIRWYTDGQMKSKAQIIEGEISGTFTSWHENGKKATEMHFIDGKPDGINKAWYPNGRIKSIVEMEKGELVKRDLYPDE